MSNLPLQSAPASLNNAEVVAKQAIRDAGAAVAKGAMAPVEIGKLLYANSALFVGSNAPGDAYKLYAEGVNSAGNPATSINIEDPKVFKSGKSKFNVFLRLAATKSAGRDTLIDRTVACIGRITGKKPSVYETVLKVCRAQIDATADLTDGDIEALVCPAGREATMIGDLEALEARFGKLAETWVACGMGGKFGQAHGLLLEFLAECKAAEVELKEAA